MLAILLSVDTDLLVIIFYVIAIETYLKPLGWSFNNVWVAQISSFFHHNTLTSETHQSVINVTGKIPRGTYKNEEV